jgi:hypothetical protein
MPIIPALGRQKQEDGKFKASYTVKETNSLSLMGTVYEF